jgi:hypothetical protein
VGNSFSDGVFNADQTDDDKITLDLFFGAVLVIVSTISVGEEESTKCIISKFFELGVEGILECFGDFDGASASIKILGAVLEEKIWGALDIDGYVSTLSDNDAAGLGLGREGDDLDDIIMIIFTDLTVVVS